MYETEANRIVENSDQIPLEVMKSFESLKGKLLLRTVLPWSEHCTECVWPTCYTSCDLYSPRHDGRCRRFRDGMVRVESPFTTNSYLMKIRFKQWGKLWTPGNVRLHAAKKAEKLEKRDYRIGSMIQNFPLPSLVQITVAQKRYGFKKRVATSKVDIQELPTSFLIECYNPEPDTVQLSLTMRSRDERSKMPFQKLIKLTPGFHCVRVPIDEIAKMIDVRGQFEIELIPNDEAKETTLYFGLMEFVQEKVESKKSEKGEKKIKCVVWDLDHTLWEGVLVEDGFEKLKLKTDIASIVQALDDRGILLSIASKNNKDEALQVVKKFQLEEYFLCPQISWQPKSQAIRAIAKQLNIGMDSILFVDDSKFELEEVKAGCPEVRLMNAEQYRTLLDRSDCQVPITAESKERRKMYQLEETRQNIAEEFSNDYTAFLRHCKIQLKIRPMTEENLERVHELTQRTNQMNFSGNRYDRDVLKNIMTVPYLDTFVISCEDQFGSYGVIGFSVVDNRTPRMIDLMFSCRIQSKRVEHAFLTYIIRRYIAETGNDFYADYRKTARNAPSGQVFNDFSMEETEIKDGVSSLAFRKDQELLDDKVISVLVEQNQLATI